MLQEKEAKKAKKTFDAQTVDTGETKVFFGWTARHLITIIRGTTHRQLSEATIDGWYINLPQPGCSPAYMRQGRVDEVTVDFLTPRQSNLVYTGFVPPGLAVWEKVTTTNRFMLHGLPHEIVLVVERNVEEISDAPLDPALFTVPADFIKVDHLPPNLNLPRPELLRR